MDVFSVIVVYNWVYEVTDNLKVVSNVLPWLRKVSASSSLAMEFLKSRVLFLQGHELIIWKTSISVQVFTSVHVHPYVYVFKIKISYHKKVYCNDLCNTKQASQHWFKILWNFLFIFALSNGWQILLSSHRIF